MPEPETAPVYPETGEGLFVDDMPAFGGHREIFVTVRRAGKPDVTFRSKTPVTDRAGAGDHSTMAACWPLD